MVSVAIRRELDRDRSGDPYIWLVTFRHSSTEDIHVARYPVDVVSNGITYQKGWFDLETPYDKNEPPKGRITIPNIDRRYARLLIALTTPPRVRLQAILESRPDIPVENYDFLFMRGISGDSQFISGTLDSWNFTTETYPARFGERARYPGVWL